jgi:hypothetical protein|tara:strand:- start:429 stop:686 length:258 start_codon:yes stop_codon:yes gene_type:complete
MPNENQKIKAEMNPVIEELKNKGVNLNSHKDTEDLTGLGDVVESVLQSFGITEERFKEWFNLKECGCRERKKWLNNLFSWKKNRG